MKLLASLLFVAVTILGVSSLCPRKWSYFEGNCYRYGDKFISWTQAQVVCEAHGGKLAEISSREQNDYLKSTARVKLASCVWLGGEELFHEGVWEWSSTSDTINGFTDWAPGQPSGKAGEDCLSMYSKASYAWDDNVCNEECNFFCSKPSTETAK